MKPIPLDPLFLFFGGAGCFVLLSGCLLVAFYLFSAHRPHPGAVVDSWDNDSLVMDGFLSGWPVRLLMVLLGGSLLVVACLRWASLVRSHLRRPATRPVARLPAPELRPAGLFPWD